MRTSMVNYIGVLLGAFFTIYLAPKFLTTEYNGLYRLLLEYAGIVAVYLNLGIPTVINKYYFQIFKEDRFSKGFDFFVFVVPFILMLICSFVFIIYRSEIVQLISSKSNYTLVYSYICFLIPLVLCYAYFFILEAYSAILGNIFVVNVIKNVVVKIFNIASVLTYVFTQDFMLSMYIVSIGTLLCVIASFVYILKLKNFKVDFSPSFAFLTENKLTADFSKFITFIIVSNLTFFLVSKIDVFFVGRYTDLSSLAYYTTATFFVTILLIPYSAILNISFPKIAQMYFKDGAGGDLIHMVRSNATFGLAMASYIFIMVWVNIDTIYSIIPNGNLYRVGKYVFLILGIGKLVDISIGSTGQLLTVSKWYYLTLLFSIVISIISVTLGFYLTKYFGIYGTAFSSTICIMFFALFQITVVWKKMGIFAFSIGSLIVFCLIPVIILFSYLFDMLALHYIVSSVIKTMFSTIIFFGVLLKCNVSDEIQQLLHTLKSKIRL